MYIVHVFKMFTVPPSLTFVSVYVLSYCICGVELSISRIVTVLPCFTCLLTFSFPALAHSALPGRRSILCPLSWFRLSRFGFLF